MPIDIRLALAAAALTVSSPAALSAIVQNGPVPDAPLVIRTGDAGLNWGPCPPIFPAQCRIAVLHGAPTQPNADILLRLPGGGTLATHRHSSAERMMLVEGRMRVQYRGASAMVLTPGTYAYGPAGLPHRADCLGPARCMLFIAFEGPVDAEAVADAL